MRCPWAFLALAALGASLDVQVVDMYRAMRKPTGGREGRKLESNNLADIQGVLRYVHQEIITEHAQNPDRTERKYGIDSIARYRVSVRNPDAVAATAPIVGLSALFSAFDYGVATSAPGLQELVKVGDFVGIQKHRANEAQMVASYPYYWFSLPGGCPNLPWRCIKGSKFPNCTTNTADLGVLPAPCKEYGCASKKDEAAQTCGANNFTDAEFMASCCLKYGPSFPEEQQVVIKGGLCDGKEPSGEPGCVYAYPDLEDKDFINVDDLTGITAMKCGNGERTCKDWADWRKNCFDPDKKYKKKFEIIREKDGKTKGEVQEVDYCVEYDLHPFCQDTPDGCYNYDCMQLKPEEKELGLEFWQGRCDEGPNTKRAESIARKAFGQEELKNHVMVDKELLKSNFKCSGLGGCVPNKNGGPYCTRQFGGVCTACYIPGTKDPFHNEEAFPTCPFDILKDSHVAPETECKSNSAADVCCLYGITPCSESFDDGSKVELSLAGFLGVMAKSLEDPEQMYNFAKHWVEEEKGGTVEDEAKFKDEVYWMWRIHPHKRYAEGWEVFQKNLEASSAVKLGGSTTTGATTSAGAENSTSAEIITDATTTGADATTAAAAADDGGGKRGGLTTTIVIVAIAGAVCLAAAWFFLSGRRTGPRGSSVEEDHRSLQMTRL